MQKTFTRDERLKSRKTIEQLFEDGKSFGQYPLRIIWKEVEQTDWVHPAQFALSVPKRKFPKAVHRNRIKRKVREVYRLNKHKLYRGLDQQRKQIALMILYTAKEELNYTELEKAMKGIIFRLLKKMKTTATPTNRKE